MIYVFILLAMYCLFLTLFIVKIQNQLDVIQASLTNKKEENIEPPSVVIDNNILPPTFLQTDRGLLTTLSPEEEIKQEELKLDEAAKAFEAVINSKSREEIDQWINSDNISEMPTEESKSLGEGRKSLHNLNKNYNKEY